MRARLLDMGEVSAVRSQSIYHAIAAVMDRSGTPTAVLLRPASSFISIGVELDPIEEIDLALCLVHRIPVLWQHAGGPPRVIGRNRLLVACTLPAETVSAVDTEANGPLVEACGALGLAVRLAPEGELVASADGDRGSRAVGNSRVGTIEGSSWLVADLAVEPEPVIPMDGPMPGVPAVPVTSLTDELGAQPESATVAEAVVAALEASLGFEFLPSMPTPEEMEAIYEWDERLVLDLETLAGTQARPADQLVC